MMEKQGYDVSDYNYFTIGEVSTMFVNKQLDILLKRESDNKKVYIKYHLAKTLRQGNVYEFIEDLFTLEEILTPSDDLIIIMKDAPNDTLIKLMQDIWEQDNIYISIFQIKKLQFNVLEHSLVPPHFTLSDKEEADVRKKYNIMDDSQLSDISRFSLVAQAIGLRPGKICKIERPSKTSITTNYYRICS